MLCQLLRRRWLCLALLAAGAIHASGTAGAEPRQLRVLSYNIHHAEGVDRQLDVERIARVILSVNPDLVALQEVDQRVTRTRGIDQPAELARLTRLQVVFGGNIPLQGGHYGNAVLSRFPITRQQNHRLPNIGGSEQRGVLEVEIALPPDQQPLRLYATHLDFRPDDRERWESAEKINSLVTPHPAQPALLAGDLNDVPGSRTLTRFATQWSLANEKPLATIPVEQPKQQIDFVLFRPQARWRVTEVRVLEEAVASDHRAILAVLELLPAPPRARH